MLNLSAVRHHIERIDVDHTQLVNVPPHILDAVIAGCKVVNLDRYKKAKADV